MLKYQLTIGLFDKDTETQLIQSSDAKNIISNILLNKFDIFAFTMFDCSGIYRMQSTGAIISEPSVRVEIATDAEIPAAEIIAELKSKLNQEAIMLEIADANISFI